MSKNRRKTMSSNSTRKAEYETFKNNEFLNRQRRESISSFDDLNNSNFTSSQQMLFATLLTDPEKREKVLELLTKEGLVPPKENIPVNGQLSASKKLNRVKVLSQENKGSPSNKGKNKFKFESPSSKLRRIELEKLNEEKKRSLESEEDILSSDETVPTHEILRGVTAYCEVRSGQEDRSELIRRAMLAMGATVLDRLNSRSITHVVFRDGAYRTYERARLLGAKLVSVLWIEACRKKGRRVNEDKYPALGSRAQEFNLTDVCGRLQDSDKQLSTQSSSSSVSVISISEDSNMSEQSGIVPASQQLDEMYNVSRFTNDMSPRKSNDLAKQVRDSFELKQSLHIRSPESIAQRQKRKSAEIEGNDSMELHVTSDISKSTCSEKSSLNNTTKNEQLENKPKSKVSLTKRRRTVAPNMDKMVDQTSKDYCTDCSTDQSKHIFEDSIEKTNTPDKLSPEKSTTNLRNNRKSTRILRNSSIVASTSHQNTNDNNTSNETSKNQSEKSQKNSNKPSKKKRNSPELKTNLKDNTNIENDQSSESIHLLLSDEPKKDSESLNENLKSKTDDKEDTDLSNKNNETKSKRRLFDPLRHLEELENMEFRWSQHKPMELPKQKTKYRVQVPTELKAAINLSKKAQKYIKNTKSSSSSDKTSDEKNKLTSKKVIDLKNDRRKSLRNVRTSLYKSITSSTDDESPKKDLKKKNLTKNKKSETDSDEFYSAEKSPDNNKTNKITKKDTDTRQKTPEKIKTNLKNINTPSRRSIRISNITKTPLKTPSININKIKTPNTKTKRNLKEKITQNDIKTPKKSTKKIDNTQQTNGDCNASRLLDKIISKEVSDRRSTFEFENPGPKTQSNKSPQKKYGTIVCTRLHRQESEVFIAIVRKLGGFRCHEDQVSKNTTHLVAGDTGRTVNLLKAIARGCWIVRHEWLLRSAEAGRWLPELEYELTNFSPSVKLSRTERQVFGRHHQMDILAGKHIWITAGSSPARADLQELVSLAGGKTAKAPRSADVILGERMTLPTAVCLSETWLLDCIKHYKCLPYDDYLLQEHQVFGRHHQMDLLGGKHVWITAGSSPARADLQELVSLAGGKLTKAPRSADVILGERMTLPTAVCLSETWLLDCIKHYKCLPYDDYLLQVKLSRTERQVFGRHHQMDLLAGKHVWITAGSSPARADLQELVSLAGGKTAKAPRSADVILGERMTLLTAVCLSETWLLDCIKHYKCLPYDDYLLQGPNST